MGYSVCGAALNSITSLGNKIRENLASSKLTSHGVLLVPEVFARGSKIYSCRVRPSLRRCLDGVNAVWVTGV